MHYTFNDGNAGAQGSGGLGNDTANRIVDIAPVNDAPVNTVPGAQSVNEETNLAIAGLAISDVDAGSGTLTTTLSVAHGTLTVASAGGAGVAGSGTGSVTLTGTLDQINTTLSASNNVLYRGAQDFNGGDVLNFVTNDGGNTGTGGALSDTDTVAITVNAVNDAPVNTVPGAQSGNEDTNFAIAGLAISDVDAGSGTLTTTLSVAHGTLTVASAGGAGVAGSGTGSVTLTGTLDQINTTLSASNNVLYRGAQDFNGGDVLNFVTNDGGNTGTGGALSDIDTVAITVNPVNDAPVNTVPASFDVEANTTAALARPLGGRRCHGRDHHDAFGRARDAVGFIGGRRVGLGERHLDADADRHGRGDRHHARRVGQPDLPRRPRFLRHRHAQHDHQ